MVIITSHFCISAQKRTPQPMKNAQPYDAYCLNTHYTIFMYIKQLFFKTCHNR